MHELIHPEGDGQNNNETDSLPLPDEIQTQLENESTDQSLLDAGKGFPAVNLNQD